MLVWKATATLEMEVILQEDVGDPAIWVAMGLKATLTDTKVSI